jgi:DNA-directed RNA polymerase specialized sigma24 family protein
MESVVFYMKDTLGLTYHEIAVELNRDDRTIWTVYNRAKSKKGDKK